MQSKYRNVIGEKDLNMTSKMSSVKRKKKQNKNKLHTQTP